MTVIHQPLTHPYRSRSGAWQVSWQSYPPHYYSVSGRWPFASPTHDFTSSSRSTEASSP